MRVILNFAKDGNYLKGQKRLSDSLNNHGYRSARMFYTDETELGSEPHFENPYNFKIHAFDKAIAAGYTYILWVDASVYTVRPVAPLFEIIEREGYIMQEAGHMAGSWTNDKTLEYFGVTRDEAMNMPMYGNAGLLGLNTNNKTAMDFYSAWRQSMIDGMFKGAWHNNDKTESDDERCKGHRHDMSCGSIIANRLGMKYYKGDEILQYTYGVDREPKSDKIILLAEGL